MRFGSLFSGIGGLDLGLERAGMTCAWQVEKDPFCSRVLYKHWPHVPKFSDVRDVGRVDYVGHASRVDLLAGGFPCQDVSQNGKQAGIEGERSGLWFEFRRLIGLLGPDYVLVENVAGLKSRGLSTVLGDLVALGYDAEWDCLPAKAFGAPHQRDRIFIIAYRPEGTGHLKELPDAQRPRLEGVPVEARAVGQAAQREAPAVLGRPVARCAGWGPEPDVQRVLDGPPTELDKARLKAIGNAVVPQVAEYIGRCILDHARRRR